VALPSLLVAGDVTNWYQSQGFNTEPRWAMLVEVEAKVSEKNCCQNGQNSSSEPRFQALSLDGLDKWSLDQGFRWKLCLEEPISNLRTFLSAKRLPWSCYEAQEV
jgi:hypothetical protein